MGATGYTWTLPSGANISAGAGTNSITVIFGSTSGDITVKATNSAGDGAVATLSLTVNSLVTPSINITSNDADNNIAKGTNVTFTANATNGGANPTYQWQINGVDVAGATTLSFETKDLNDGDKVGVVMTSSEACVTNAKATSNEIAMSVGDLLTSLSGQLTNAGLKVFPNPTVDKVTLQIAGKVSAHIQVDLFDLLGRKADAQRGNLSNGTFELNVEHLAEGKYILKIYVGNEMIVRSIVKR